MPDKAFHRNPISAERDELDGGWCRSLEQERRQPRRHSLRRSVHLIPGESDHRVATSLEPLLTLRISLAVGGGRVPGAAVQLHDQLPALPEHVRAEPPSRYVRLRYRQAKSFAEEHEVPLESVGARASWGRCASIAAPAFRLPARPPPSPSWTSTRERRPLNSARAITRRSALKLRAVDAVHIEAGSGPIGTSR